MSREDSSHLVEVYTSREHAVGFFHDQGTTHFLAGNYDKALWFFSEVIRIDPNLAIAYFKRGITYEKKGEQDQALNDYTESIRLDSAFAPAYVNRGDIYRERGKYDEALHDVDRALHLDPDNADTHYTRGVVCLEKGDLHGATQAYTEAVRLDPNHAKAYANRGAIYAGTRGSWLSSLAFTLLELVGFDHPHKRRYDQAIQDCDQAIRLDPKDAIAFYNRGRAYAQKREYHRARRDLNQARLLGLDRATVEAMLAQLPD